MKQLNPVTYRKQVYILLILLATILAVGCGSKIENKNSAAEKEEKEKKVVFPPGSITVTDPTTGTITRKSCNSADDCGVKDSVCGNNKCYEKDDPCANIQCEALERCERGKGGLSNIGVCVPNCSEEKQCGGKCSDSKTKECVAFQWVEPCEGQKTHCLTSTGPLCCPGNQECVGSACVETGESCNLKQEEYCQMTHYCEESIGKCVDYKKNTSLCTLPDTKNADPEVVLYKKNEVVYVTPLVIDLNRDKIPEIIYLKFIKPTKKPAKKDPYNSELVVIKSQPKNHRNDSVEVVWEGRGDNGNYIYSDIAPAAAELDGNVENGPEIVVLVNDKGKPQSAIKAFHANGSKYFQTPLPSDTFHADAGGISIGDIDADGHPEIVTLGHVYSHTGQHLFTLPMDKSQLTETGEWGADNDLRNDVPVLVDINKDGYLDIIEGQMVFLYKPNSDGSMNFEQPTLDDTTTAKATRPYPYGATTAVANFDTKNKNAYPQIVNVYDNKVVLADWRGKVIAEADSPTLDGKRWSEGGSPTIGDFDNDGKPEIGVAFSGGLVVYDVEADASGALKLEIAWYFKATDNTSEITGTSVFDFDGDGIAEIVFVDNKKLYILNGEKGERDPVDQKLLIGVMTSIHNPNQKIWGTSLEPVVADVDNDKHADIVAASNNGIRVLSHPEKSWVPTLPIWNQHAYNVTNINIDGSVPQTPKNNWEYSWLNNFRQNVQAGNHKLAPDILIKVEPPFNNSCVLNSGANLTIKYQVHNIGSATAEKDSVTAKVYRVENGVSTLLSTTKNTKDLAPNGLESFQLDIDISKIGTTPFDLKFVVDKENKILECNENNNEVVLNSITSAAADASVTINNIDHSACISSGPVNITYTISNNGQTDIPADTLPISIYYQIGTGQRVKLADNILNNKPIPANGSIEMNYEWPTYTEGLHKQVKVEIVIDEPNNIVECNETNNTAESHFVCYIAG